MSTATGGNDWSPLALVLARVIYGCTMVLVLGAGYNFIVSRPFLVVTEGECVGRRFNSGGGFCEPYEPWQVPSFVFTVALIVLGAAIVTSLILIAWRKANAAAQSPGAKTSAPLGDTSERGKPSAKGKAAKSGGSNANEATSVSASAVPAPWPRRELRAEIYGAAGLLIGIVGLIQSLGD